MTAPFSPAAIANGFLEKSGDEKKPITPMQLLKLVYIAHGWNLAVTGEPLFDEPVQAWPYGPVVPSLFHEFKRYGSSPIKHLAQVPLKPREPYTKFADLDFETEAPFVEDETTNGLIDWVWNGYGHLSGWQLSRMTHEPSTPWSITMDEYRKNGKSQTIPNDLIRAHYLELWNKRHTAPAAS